ncbi:thermonuclease family protein [Mesorhizobium sp. M4B.F.Ca.ET.190.01.1.1]|uniref:thermonuclease family protein n=2 Tax=Mesorhizobium TaxID=68287 RepID=UPI001092E7D2|nr:MULTISPECIES: thermonuclease family protein [unclassified Mesorhizobium]TGR08244.1 thermonuclease family protein [Mesorhizobium sp. M4B.F.Ca.ET.200.01.1.1]TGS17601.1 thermonuclease family protein [Mesorhizobium sp. M4B.F.Ca.ET.190.01.1.1]TGT29925.1 thermonuclease family protein [Mesorhizobium sp. M4B.F.Ca.ET.172.01.1.1]
MSGIVTAARSRLAIALGGVELLAGVLLILQAGALIGVDRPTPALDVAGSQPSPTAVFDAGPRQPARKIAEDLIAPPELDATRIERIEARPPLGELGLAYWPKTPMPGDWREMLLYRPIATSSATFEAMGRTVAISGALGIEPDRSCSFHEAAWPCGQRARAAFNAWLRGRALKCFVPPDVDRFAIAAPCKLGKQDVGAWLVSNGWATALPGGIYGKAEATARSAEMGMFGPPR